MRVDIQYLLKVSVFITLSFLIILEKDVGFKPSTSLRNGLRSFVEWYANYKFRV